MSETQPQIIIDLKLIAKKKKSLEKVKAELKKEFIGIDYVIDELVDYIQIWYLMPEVLTRPIIVNLWGMTGVGKTDLVRKLVNKLNYQDRFVEVELSNSSAGASGYQHYNTVANILTNNRVDDGKPSIILFDEIQRFCTIDVEGKPIQNTSFNDFWELLSDGKLAKRAMRDEMEEMMDRYLFASMQRKKKPPKKEDNTDEYDPYSNDTLGLWNARRLKATFGFEDDLYKLAEMKEEDIIKTLERATKEKKIYEAVDYSKALLIISGNLDDAFSMSTETSESDVDADIFHAYTEKISIVNIKKSLSTRFKPEQVARFGNIHLIYKSLKKKDFEQLIAVEIKKIIEKNLRLFGVTVVVDKSINRLLYQNGVFPVQGVRPVFSSVIDILEANLTKFLYEAFMTEQRSISVDYDFTKQVLSGTFENGEAVVLPYIGRIDMVRQRNLADAVANVSVHEAGHAVVYGVLFGLSPLQLKSKVASNYAGGFTFPHQIYMTKENMQRKIQIYLAGGLAEDLIFGEANATIGRENDREQTVTLATDYLRKYGFDPEFQAYYVSSGENAMGMLVTDKSVEAMIQMQVVDTRKILADNRSLLIELSVELNKYGSLDIKTVAAIAKKHGHNWKVKGENYLHLNGYAEQLRESEKSSKR